MEEDSEKIRGAFAARLRYQRVAIAAAVALVVAFAVLPARPEIFGEWSEGAVLGGQSNKAIRKASRNSLF